MRGATCWRDTEVQPGGDLRGGAEGGVEVRRRERRASERGPAVCCGFGVGSG